MPWQVDGLGSDQKERPEKVFFKHDSRSIADAF